MEWTKRIIQKGIDSYIIFSILFFIAFVIPIFPDAIERSLYEILLPVLFIGVVYYTIASERPTYIFTTLVFSALGIRWVLSPIFQSTFLEYVGQGILTLTFIYGVFLIILDIVKENEVDIRIILDSISGYLLLGLAYSSLIAYVHGVDENAFNLDSLESFSMSDYNYYAFVTLSTLGYGDIVPQSQFAKSLATLGSVAGQMYVAIIIALLVGKFSAVGLRPNIKDLDPEN